MRLDSNYIIRGKCLIIISVAFLIIATGLIIIKQDNEYLNVFNFEYINIKDMASTSIANKTGKTNLKNLFKYPENKGQLVETAITPLKNSEISRPVEKQIWYLPTELGVVTQNPSYNHVALDITSPRGVQEYIFPVANGTISGIYTDNAGAKIITISHNINGKYYTSQYVHLSAYAADMYVGKAVTINDAIGKMGATGMATGVHLHLAILDCNLFSSTDPNCQNLGSFYNYANQRLAQGYIGLGTMMNVPGNWNNR